MPSCQPLVLAELADSTRAAAEAFIAAGTAANTVRSNQSARPHLLVRVAAFALSPLAQRRRLAIRGRRAILRRPFRQARYFW